MKKGLLVIFILLMAASMFAFPQGTLNPGGSVAIYSYKASSSDEATTVISFQPQLGYFVKDNISVDWLLNFTNMSEDNDSYSEVGIGLGGRYFYGLPSGKLYGGLGILYQSDSSKYEYSKSSYSYSSTATYLKLKGGYLFPLVENVYVDLGAKIMVGFGDYGGDSSGPNKESQLGVDAGLQIFFPKK